MSKQPDNAILKSLREGYNTLAARDAEHVKSRRKWQKMQEGVETIKRGIARINTGIAPERALRITHGMQTGTPEGYITIQSGQGTDSAYRIDIDLVKDAAMPKFTYTLRAQGKEGVAINNFHADPVASPREVVNLLARECGFQKWLKLELLTPKAPK